MTGPTLTELVDRGVLSFLDFHFARAMGRLVEEERPEVLLGAAFASRAVQRGHVCADLGRLSAGDVVDADENVVADLELPPIDAWVGALRASELVSAPDAERPTPLVLDAGGRLYLHRYASYQSRLARELRARARAAPTVDDRVLREGLDRLFAASRGRPDEQRLAALMAVNKSLCVISGGPGTGKTHTVAKILALLREQAEATRSDTFRTLLVAPTGKAAQRLGASIEANLDRLDCSDATKTAIRTTPATIHRALGYQQRSPTRFRHDAENPLPADVVLVDEASMVDLALMTKLAEAVPEAARLILLGDKDQLASVEAGAILGDIYNTEADHTYSEDFTRSVHELGGGEVPSSRGRGAGIQDCMVHLTHSYRYGETSGIGALARDVNSGDAGGAFELLKADEPHDVGLVEIESEAHLAAALRDSVQEGFGVLATMVSARAKLDSLERFRVLCAHRRGPFGVENVNPLIADLLREIGLVPDGEWYEGRPIIVTQNDYQLDLFNGDVGVVARDDAGDLRAFFPGEGKKLRAFVPARLPPHETVFAMTVHKSQGSEFDEVGLVLPPEASPILTRELVYTGITRARSRVRIYGGREVLGAAVERRIERASGLREALWQAD